MTPREELAALRRIKELEDKAGGRAPKADFSGVSASVDRGPAKRKPSTYNLTGIPGVSTQIGGFLDAAQHHAMSLPHGIAQAVGNGVNAAANAVLPAPEQTMSGVVSGQAPQARTMPQKLRQYINETTASDNAAMRQREEDYQARTDGNAGSYGGAVAGEIAPFAAAAPARALQWVGEKAAGALPKAAPQLLRRITSGTAQGMAVSATSPVVGEGSYGDQKGVQLAVGGALGGAIPGAAAVARGAMNVARPIVAPQRVADANVARLFGSDQATVDKLRSAQQFVPGERVTAAQALQTPEAVRAEKALRNRPDLRGTFDQQDIDNNALRLGVLDRHAGTDDDLAKAVQARRDVARPFRDQFLPEEGSPLVDATPITDTLQKLALSANATVRAAAKEHLGLLKAHAAQNGGKVPAFALDDVRQNVGGMLAKHAPVGASGTAEAAKYGPVSTQIIRALDRQIPGYRDHLAAYRDSSVPINTMESARRIIGPIDVRGRNSGGDANLTLGGLNTGLNRVDKQRYGLSPEARTDLQGVRQSLQRESVSNSLKSPGSDTAYNLSADGWLARQMYGPTMEGPTNKTRGLAALVGGYLGHQAGIPGGEAAGAGIGLYINKAAEAINSRIASKVGAGATDSQEAARMIERFLKQNPKEAPKLLEAYPQWAALLGYEPRALPAR